MQLKGELFFCYEIKPTIPKAVFTKLHRQARTFGFVSRCMVFGLATVGYGSDDPGKIASETMSLQE